MKLKYIKILGLIVCSLMLSMVPSPCFNASTTTNTVGDDILNEIAGIPVNTSVENNSTNIVQNYINSKCPNLTVAENLKIYDMMQQQWDGPNGNTKFNFLIAYLNNSSEYPIQGLSYTARELYSQSAYYHSWISAVDNIINDYGHMTRKQRVEFLITKNPTLKEALTCFNTNDQNKLYFLSDSISDLEVPEYDGNVLDVDKAINYKNNVQDYIYKFSHTILTADMYYDMYCNNIDFNEVEIYNNSLLYDSLINARSDLAKVVGIDAGAALACLITGSLFCGIAGVGNDKDFYQYAKQYKYGTPIESIVSQKGTFYNLVVSKVVALYRYLYLKKPNSGYMPGGLEGFVTGPFLVFIYILMILGICLIGLGILFIILVTIFLNVGETISDIIRDLENSRSPN